MEKSLVFKGQRLFCRIINDFVFIKDFGIILLIGP